MCALKVIAALNYFTICVLLKATQDRELQKISKPHALKDDKFIK